jgi:hypothetical protein
MHPYGMQNTRENPRFYRALHSYGMASPTHALRRPAHSGAKRAMARSVRRCGRARRAFCVYNDKHALRHCERSEAIQTEAELGVKKKITTLLLVLTKNIFTFAAEHIKKNLCLWHI